MDLIPSLTMGGNLCYSIGIIKKKKNCLMPLGHKAVFAADQTLLDS